MPNYTGRIRENFPTARPCALVKRLKRILGKENRQQNMNLLTFVINVLIDVDK